VPEQQSSSDSRSLLRDPLELRILGIWRQLLGTAAVGFNDNFFEAGGHSLLALQLLSRIEEVFGRKLTLPDLFEAPTVEGQAALLTAPGGATGRRRRIARLHDGSGSPFFCIGAGPLFLELSRSVGSRPFLGVWLGDMEDRAVPYTVEETAAEAVRTIREVQPEGPYWLGGWCAAGLIAFEAAQQLMAAGQKVSQLVLFETVNSACYRPRSMAAPLKFRLHIECERLKYHLSRLTRKKPAEAAVYAWRRVQGIFEHIADDGRGLGLGTVRPDSERTFQMAARSYTPACYPGPVVLIRCMDRPAALEWDTAASWKGLLNGDVRLFDIPGDHRTMFHQPNAGEMASRLRECLL
jgi:thioesterase domain-containing protein/acyl carrier protein